MTEHTGWTEVREQRVAEPVVDEAYEAARIAFELRRTVRELRRNAGPFLRRRPPARG